MFEMISDELWGELVDKWERVGPAYQVPARSKKKLEFFIRQVIPYFEKKNVLEIGCNAGIFGYHIAQVAETYTGLEPGNLLKYSHYTEAERKKKLKKYPFKTDYFKQAQMTLEYMPENSVFVNDTIKGFIEKREEYKYNVFVAVYALYHFTDTEIKRLKEYIFPMCETVIIQTRHQFRPTAHNKYEFWKYQNVEKFFRKLGYYVNTVKPLRRGYQSIPFSIQICRLPEK